LFEGTHLAKIVAMLSAMIKVLKILERCLPALIASWMPHSFVLWRDLTINLLHLATTIAFDMVQLLIGFTSEQGNQPLSIGSTQPQVLVNLFSGILQKVLCCLKLFFSFLEFLTLAVETYLESLDAIMPSSLDPILFKATVPQRVIRVDIQTAELASNFELFALKVKMIIHVFVPKSETAFLFALLILVLMWTCLFVLLSKLICASEEALLHLTFEFQVH